VVPLLRLGSLLVVVIMEKLLRFLSTFADVLFVCASVFEILKKLDDG
jgi:hypothetical protein